MKTRLVLAGSCLCLATAVAYANWDQWMAWPKMRVPLVAALADPGSAQFRDERVVDGVICGEYNSRNRLGGYTGFKKYLSDGTRFATRGADLRSWDSSTQMAVMFSEHRESILKEQQRVPSDEDVRAAVFDTIWKQRCETSSS